MKKLYYSAIMLITLSGSCSKFEPDVSLRISGSDDVEENTVQVHSGSNIVSLNDIYTMLERDFPATKTGMNEFKIVPYIGEKPDTLMYIVNFGNAGGWKIYSSDKRTPPILAEGDSGRFSIDEGSPAVAIWMGRVADDMDRIRRSADDELSFTKEEILVNKTFWPDVQSPAALPPSPPAPGLPKGHWEEKMVSSQVVEYDRIDHMVGKWDQDYPYNACCPFYVSTPGIRAAAGCVSIAGSQVLLYLHGKFGIPETMYSEGTCIGNVDSFEKSFSKPSSSVWSSMSTEYRSSYPGTLPEAIMISYVGMKVNMHYCDNIFGQYSWAMPSNLKSDLFEPYGISCSRGSYNESTVRSSLLNKMPVIVSGSNLLVPVDGDIHCFVIDGYRRTQIKYTHYYEYVYDEITSGPLPAPYQYVTETYGSPEFAGIRINWGWRSQWDKNNPLNDGWYSLTGGWTVTNGGTYDYNYYLNMTYGFAKAN